MRVTVNTPDTLVVGARPWLLGLALIGFILVFAGVGVTLLFSGNLTGLLALIGAGLGYAGFYLMVRRVQAVFNRPGGWFEIRRRSLRGAVRVRHALADLDRAEVETSYGSDSDTYRVVLVIGRGESAGRHPLTGYYTNGAGHARTAAAINDWLRRARA